ncbi:MAG: hypothetical protein AB1716_14510 [Planctomycetota bacterium]
MRWSAVAVTLGVLASAGWTWAEPGADAIRLQQAYPGIGFYQDGTPHPTQVYGAAFGHGASPEEAAAAFVRDYAGVFGAAAEDLHPGRVATGLRTQPLMFDAQRGDYRFTLVYYTQQRDGLPVCGAELRLLVRNEPGHPLVLARSTLKPLGGFRAGTAAPGAESAARAAAAAQYPDLSSFQPAETTIWAGSADANAEPRLALVFEANNGAYATADFQKRLFVADARTGAILDSEDLIRHTDIVGTVKGMGTVPPKADQCADEVLMGLPYARVTRGFSAFYADVDGNFVIPNEGTSQVTIVSTVRGRYFRVFNMGGNNSGFSYFVIPPGPVNFVYNAQNRFEFLRAEVNGYIQANVVRDFALVYNPDYPVIRDEVEFPVNVNINERCNAFYDGHSINFFQGGSGCANTAYASVVHHEYGHHLVRTGGSGQGAYGEGMSDCVALLIADDPILGYGFQSDCNHGLRNAQNNFRYPCSGEIHYCGQLLSGCVWSTRLALGQRWPSEALDLVSRLTINSILLHTGTSINPQITADFLTLDDDDATLINGTPHYAEIAAGFGAHLMPPPTPPLVFRFPAGRPAQLPPDRVTRVRVDILNATLTHRSGTGLLHIDAGGVIANLPMEPTGPDTYEAVFPPLECGRTIQYAFSAAAVSGERIYDPLNAPHSMHSAAGCLRGDLDCSGRVDLNDIQPFVLALGDRQGYQAMFPACPFENGDCNGDGLVDFNDIAAFVAVLSR